MDGFVGTIGSDDPSWWLPYYVDEPPADVIDLLTRAGVHAMDRPGCEDMGPYWQASSEPFATPRNATPKAMFSRSLREGTRPETTVHGEGVVEAMQDLEARGAHGGARLAQTLTHANLIDEYHLNLHPTALVEGVPLFGGALQLNLRSTRTLPRGTTVLTNARLP